MKPPKSGITLATFALLAASLCVVPQVRAGTFALSNTGVDAGGIPLVGGSPDPHWSIVAGPGISTPIPAVVISSPPGVYATSPVSRWIWRDANSGGTGPFTFRLEFDLTGLDANTAEISGAWGVDNVGEIFLNGSPAPGTGALNLAGFIVDNFDHFHAFTINGGFVAGVNTLDFVAMGDGFDALNVTDLAGTAASLAVPEPSGLVMIGGGLIGMLAYVRCRKGQATPA